MWALRILNGPQAGQIFVLRQGRNRIGRSSSVDFQLNVGGISKEHMELQVFPDRIVLNDLQSSNGSFVNGVRVHNTQVRIGDKIGLDRVLCEIIPAPAMQNQALVPAEMTRGMTRTGMGQGTSTHYPTALTRQTGFSQHHPAQSRTSVDPVRNENRNQMRYEDDYSEQPISRSAAGPSVDYQAYQEKIETFVNDKILKALYQTLEVFEFKAVIMGFSVVFILMVTLLSILPMNQITSESIKTESRRRAITVARALANANEKAIRTGEMAGYSADLVLRDEGISNVYILGKDGSIIAPPEMSGMTPRGDAAGFASRIKGQVREMSEEISGGKLAASVPILVFDPELQQNVAKAHAVVVYDPGSLKFDDGRALGLFVQMLAIALIFGSALFYLMYRLIEHPIIRLNEEIDEAMRENRDHAVLNIKFPALQSLVVNLNSLLSRASQGGGSGAQNTSMIYDQEWMNLTQLFGYPALLINKDLTVLSMNQAFESLTGIVGSQIQGQPLQFLPDQAMQKNILELTEQSAQNRNQVQFDKLEISGTMFSLQCQAIAVGNETKFFMITISPSEEMQGGAA